jgi:hypothetical protein
VNHPSGSTAVVVMFSVLASVALLAHAPHADVAGKSLGDLLDRPSVALLIGAVIGRQTRGGRERP